MDEKYRVLLAQVAVWYFEDGLEQREIANRIGKSRSMVSRMLTEARKSGIVKFTVDYPLRRDRASEKALERLFGLDEAWVLSNIPWSDELSMARLRGKLGALCVQSRLFNGVRIGVGVGHDVLEVIRAFPSLELREAEAVQLIGTLSSKQTEIDSGELTRLLAEKLHAESVQLSSPAIVSSKTTARSLLHERSIEQALEAGANVDVALVGIGSLDPETSSLFAVGAVSRKELEAFGKAGAVADFLGHCIDSNGVEVDLSYDRHVIGVPLKALPKIPSVIAVAAGPGKVEAIRAALRGRYFDVLVTDEKTSESLIKGGTRTQPDSGRYSGERRRGKGRHRAE